MKVYEAWKKSLELLNGEREEALFWGEYYDKETQNYKKILGEKSFALKGTEAELAEQFNMEPPVFAGFIDGANTSLKEQVDLEALEDTTELNMEFEPESSITTCSTRVLNGCIIFPSGRTSSLRKRGMKSWKNGKMKI